MTDEDLAAGRYAEVCAIFDDPGCLVPEAGPAARPATLDWLRELVARFSNGAGHDRRRALIEADLARLDPGALERAAHGRTLAGLREGRDAGWLARTVPVATLAAGMGVAEAHLLTVADAVNAIAPAYLTGGSPEQREAADDGVRRLLPLLGEDGRSPEVQANRAGLLVQACAATAQLIVSASARMPSPWPIADLLSETLRHDPPARSTRRRRPDGATVVLDLAAANRDPAVFTDPDRFDPDRRDGRHLTFGHGPRACPGAAQALALARGVVTALQVGATPM